MIRRSMFAVLLLAGIPGALVAQTPKYLDPDQSLPQRVADLVSRMTLDEKISQMMDVAPAIERLGVPEYNWWNEALHGVARSGLATVFPQAIGLAATWDDSLMHRAATVISDEARAKHHEYVRNGKRLRYQGLTIWSPNINLFRDPRWGRGQETYGEDPFLTGRMAVQFVRGLQGDDPQYLKTVSTVKHYAVHSGPEPDRHTFDAVVSERDLRETYLPAFRAGITQGGAYSLMCAYNRVFGKPACASNLLEAQILRGEWGFQGYVVSDCGAINDIYERHKVAKTAAQAAATAVKSGTDLECGDDYRSLVDAVKQGLISQAEIDTAVSRLFRARFRLGMFDPPSRVKYAQIPYSILDQPKHRELARQAARESIVLLKNQGNLLPLSKNLRTIAVIGPNADEPYVLYGNYNGTPADPITPLRGIREAVPNAKVLYARGSELADSFPSYMTVPARQLFDENGQPGLKAEYFTNADMSGAPIETRKDSTVDASWGAKAPRADLDPDNFAVRWTGVLRPEQTGTYRLGLNGNMRYELYLDDSLVVRSTYNYRNEFGDPRLRTGPSMVLEQGKSYRIRVEAHETYGDAEIHLMTTRLAANLLGEALAAARQADAVVLVLGITPRLEGEEMNVHVEGFSGGDRTSLDLPATQEKLLEQVAALGKPLVLVLLSGSALSVNWADAHVPAILEAWYPGQAAGAGIADVLFGDYNPAGRLPVTFYRSVNDLPPFTDYSMRGRTYRFFSGQPLYPFGHGLSYTTFKYGAAVANVTADGVTVAADVTNVGRRAGDEVVQLYVQYLGSKVERPKRELRGYQRIGLQPGETRRVQFVVPKAQLAYWDSTTHKWVNEPGQIRLLLGASSADIRQTVVVAVSGVSQPGTAMAQDRIDMAVDASARGAKIDRNIFGQFAEHLGSGVYEGIWVGPDSPIPNTRGIRNDVVAALKALKVPNVRWPGGCFADDYHWRKGVGPMDRRTVTLNPNWGGVVETNRFGTHEFMDFLEQIGSQAYLSANVGSGTPQEAAEWLEYLTAAQPTTLAKERAANGHAGPYQVALLGIGNESWDCGGNFSADAYLTQLRIYSRFVRDFNPSQQGAHRMLKIAVGPGGDSEPRWTEWTETIMKAWRGRSWSWDIDGLSMHNYTVPRWPPSYASVGFGEIEYSQILKTTLRMDHMIATHSAIMDKYDPEKKIALVVDEWGAWYAPLPGSNSAFLVQQNSLRDAILAALNLNIFARHADRVRMANIAQMINVLQAMIITDKQQLVLTPTYHVFKMYVPFQDATFVPITYDAGSYTHGDVTLPRVDAIAARDSAGALWLAITNLDPNKSADIAATVSGMTARSVTAETLSAPNVDSVNTFDAPSTVEPKLLTAKIAGGRLTLRVAPKSVTVISVQP